MTPKYSAGLSPFHLVYGLEVVSPIEIMAPTLSKKAIKIGCNEKVLQNDKTLIDEKKLQVTKHILKYQDIIKRRYDHKVKKQIFRPGTWVLKKVYCLKGPRKLSKNWVSPFIIN